MDFYSSLDSRTLDKSTPTLFEVLSANELEGLLSPSIRFILAHYATKYPRHLIRVLNNFDELNLLARGLIELKYLKDWNSSFIEKFYGLKRCKALSLESIRSNESSNSKFERLKRLTKLQIAISLCDLLLVPYFQEKLDYLYDKIVPSYLLNTLKPKENWKDYFKQQFIRLYPTLKTSLKIINVIFNILYLSGKIRSINLLSYIFKINYSRISQTDHQLNDMRIKKSLENPLENIKRIRPISFNESILELWYNFITPVKKTSLLMTDSILPIFIFLLKFLEWYNTSNFGSLLKLNKNAEVDIDGENLLSPKILPNFVLKDKKVKKYLSGQDDDDSKCRLCHQEIHNPAVIETGYVFCYTCIFKYLREGDEFEGGRCPVTGKKLLGCRYSKSKKEWKVSNVRRLII